MSFVITGQTYVNSSEVLYGVWYGCMLNAVSGDDSDLK